MAGPSAVNRYRRRTPWNTGQPGWMSIILCRMMLSWLLRRQQGCRSMAATGSQRRGKQVSAAQPSDTLATAPVQARSPWRSAIAAGLGSAIEYYDFQLYAVLAVVISPLFFANQ